MIGSATDWSYSCFIFKVLKSMSKGSLFWANASGKLGESVYYRAGGEQRNRTYIKNVKNPKTKAQMSNRIQMLNLSAIFKELADILRFSFPNRPSKESGFNAFVKANKSATSSVNTKESIEKGIVAPYQYFVSKGDLNVSQPTEVQPLAGEKVYGYAMEDGVDNDEPLNVKMQTLVRSLGLPSGTKVTVIKAKYVDEGWRLGYVVVESTLTGSVIEKGEPITISSVTSIQDVDGNVISFGETSEDDLLAVIFSYTDANGKLMVNTAQFRAMTSDGISIAGQDNQGPDGFVYQQVLEQYGFNEGSILSTK